MKIEKLIIYGFGKHENVTIDLGPDMNVLYGLNEAGKTTIQQFILHTLFGFPQRNSAVLRYEPKSGGKFGGQIILNDDTYGRCIVERVRGKSAGDVTLFFEDGRKGGEEELTLLLRHYNRASFESIFSFSLLQLQGFEKMNEEELSRTLLASGTTGVDSLLQLEKQMEKEMGDLFKKSGRNPEINVKIKELRDLELELRDDQKKVAEYTPSIKRLREIDGHITELRDQEKAKRQQLQNLSLLRQYLPLYHKKEGLENRLKQVGTADFPSDGIRRFESLSSKLSETKAAKHRIGEELVEMVARLPKIEQSNRLAEIELLLAKESEWYGWRSQVAASEDEVRRLSSSQQRLFDRLGVQTKEESVLYQADVSIRKEEEMHELINEMNSLNTEISFVRSQCDAVNSELIGLQSDLAVLDVPSAKDIELAKEWPSIRQRLAEAKAFVSFGNSRTERNSQVLPVAMLVIALVLIVFGVIGQQWLVVSAGVIVGGIGAYLYPKREQKKSSEYEKMAAFISTYSGKEFEMEQLVARIEAYKRDKERFEEAIKALGLQQVKRTMELAGLSAKSDKVEAVFDAFIQGYGFDGLPSPGIVPELFRMIREVQEVARDMEEAVQQKLANKENMEKRIAEVEKALQQVVPPDAMYELLRREFIRLKEESETAKSLEVGIERLQSTLKEIVVLANSLEADLRALLKEGNAETDEDFYKAYDVHQEMTRFKEQLADIETQLATSGALHSLANSTDYELIQQATETEADLASVEEQLTHFINEKAALINKTEQLLTDETYSEKLQFFEMKKAELAELAKKWSARQAVSEAIIRTMLELKEGKLPKVLRHAEQMFSELTNGKYEALNITEEGYFIAVSTDGMRYPIVELSQATKEQVYISLRLALASSVLKTAPFPIIMDDPFVHFDGERLSRMIELLGATNDHQFIYFTCHKKMKEKWIDAIIINV